MNSTSWTTNESNLFDYLKDNHYPDLVKAKFQMSRWDCYSASTNHRIELKCRNKHYDELMIERKKHDAMLATCNLTLDVPIYINATPKGIYRFNLLKVDCEWVTKNIRKTTHFSQSQRIPKEVAFISVEAADVLTML